MELTVEQASIAVQAADAGKHVFIEKPMSLTIEDAERVISAQKRNNVRPLFLDWGQCGFTKMRSTGYHMGRLHATIRHSFC